MRVDGHIDLVRIIYKFEGIKCILNFRWIAHASARRLQSCRVSREYSRVYTIQEFRYIIPVFRFVD